MIHGLRVLALVAAWAVVLPILPTSHQVNADVASSIRPRRRPRLPSRCRVLSASTRRISDFRQRRMNPYRDPRSAGPLTVYRLRGSYYH
jgi:hypothetical protein